MHFNKENYWWNSELSWMLIDKLIPIDNDLNCEE